MRKNEPVSAMASLMTNSALCYKNDNFCKYSDSIRLIFLQHHSCRKQVESMKGSLNRDQKQTLEEPQET